MTGRTIIAILCLPFLIFGQSEDIERAYDFFNSSDYSNAADAFSKLDLGAGLSTKDIYFLGLCYQAMNQHEAALKQFTFLSKEELKFKNDLNVDLAHSYQATGRYTDAIYSYKAHISETRPDDDELRQTLLKIHWAINALETEKSEDVLAINPGFPLNSSSNDLNAILDNVEPRPNIYLSSQRDNRRSKEMFNPEINSKFDLIKFNALGGTWEKELNVSDSIKSTGSEIGQSLYASDIIIERSIEGLTPELIGIDVSSGDIKATLKDLPYRPDLGDLGLHVVGDIVLFSSARLGGFGAYDIFYAVKSGDKWSAPMNMGPSINGDYHECYPYLHPERNTLFYSSNNENSIGGFDVFSTSFNTDAELWEKPLNMGEPVNSPSDDIWFRIQNSEDFATLSSNRILGEGNMDIIFLYNEERDFAEAQSANSFISFILSENESEDVSSELVENAEVFEEETDEETDEPYAKYLDEYIDPIFIASKDDLGLPLVERTLDQVLDIMDLNRSIELYVQSFVSVGKNNTLDAMKALSIAQATRAKLISRGVTASRVNIQSHGSHYPITRDGFEDPEQEKYAEKMNNYVVLKLIDWESSQFTIYQVDLPIRKEFRHSDFWRFSQDNRGISYRIELYQDEVLANTSLFADRQALIESRESGRFGYLIGLFRTYSDARELWLKKKEEGYENADIIAYRNGIRLTYSESFDLIPSFPELVDYMKDKGY